MTVDGKEFRELRQYMHHPAKKQLKIPRATAVKSRIMDLGEEIVDGLKQTFAVSIVHYFLFDRFIIDFQDNTSNISISLDAWTSNNGYAFMAIVAHWVGNNGKLGTSAFLL
jgi:hypothetical protein